MRRWYTRWACFHHDHNTGQSWIGSTLADAGRTKVFWCRVCGKTWTT